MKINLRIDHEGSPYLEIWSNKNFCPDDTAEDEIIEYFIREGIKHGLYVKNENGSSARDDYASIRIKKPSPKDILFAENKEEKE